MKDKNCLRCEYVIECKGVEKDTSMCIKFTERKREKEGSK